MSLTAQEMGAIPGGLEREVDLDLVVTAKDFSAEGVVTLTLAREDGDLMPAWGPGAHVDLTLDNGLVRQYSLCGHPDEVRTWQIAVRLEPEGGGGSAYVHQVLSVGSRVRVCGPRNHFRLEEAHRYLFIAGGIGITPLVPMMAAVARTSAEWSLVYGGRSLATMPFVDALVHAYGDRVGLWPEDTHGLIDLDAVMGAPGAVDAATLVYCCGPEPLLQAVTDKCGADGAERLRFERFSSDLPPVPAGADAFEVQIGSSGQVITVGAEESILDALRRSGIPMDSSCEGGICGTCETGVLEGAVDHRDSVLTPSEREAGELMMVCVSRAKCPRLVLDM